MIATPLKPTPAAHLRIARLDHWVKNVFVLPGIAVALAVDRARAGLIDPLVMAAGLLSVGLVASSNYVLNEVLDAPYDRFHPLKRDRPVPSGQVSIPWAWVEWIALFLAGLALGAAISRAFALSMAGLWVMGCIYNIPPVRAKDIPFVDVLAEAVNNPIRFLAGWYLTGTAARPIASLLIAYWMAGCYFMAIKRFAELRELRSPARLTAYRRCYRYYTEQNLLVSILFYGAVAMLFLGAYMGRYRLEMALSFPLVAVVMAVYFGMAFKPHSAAQHPERLVREPLLMGAVAVCSVAIIVLLWVDVPLLHEAFPPTGLALDPAGQ